MTTYEQLRILEERFAALADPTDDSDWLDVRRRAGLRRSRAWIALPVAAALLALLVGSAFAYYRDVVDFFGAEKAPRENVQMFEELAIGAPPGADPQAIAAETRRIEITSLNGERRTVFIAPTKPGGLCAVWERAGGVCDSIGTVPLSVDLWERSTRAGDSSGLVGQVNARYAETVELRFSDGAVLRPPITWISEPIDQGFFHHTLAPGEIDLDRSKRGHQDGGTTVTIVALDGDGNVVTTAEPCCRVAAPHLDAIASEKTTAASISTRSGPAVIWTAPTRYDGTCAWLEFDGKTKALHCLPRGYDEGLVFRFLPTSETVLMYGTVADRYRRLDLHYADGTVEPVALDGRFLLLDIPQRHLRHETRLLGVSIDGRRLQSGTPSPATGTAACYGTLPLPPGRTCP